MTSAGHQRWSPGWISFPVIPASSPGFCLYNDTLSMVFPSRGSFTTRDHARQLCSTRLPNLVVQLVLRIPEISESGSIIFKGSKDRRLPRNRQYSQRKPARSPKTILRARPRFTLCMDPNLTVRRSRRVLPAHLYRQVCTICVYVSPFVVGPLGGRSLLQAAPRGSAMNHLCIPSPLSESAIHYVEWQ